MQNSSKDNGKRTEHSDALNTFLCHKYTRVTLQTSTSGPIFGPSCISDFKHLHY